MEKDGGIWHHAGVRVDGANSVIRKRTEGYQSRGWKTMMATIAMMARIVFVECIKEEGRRQ